jgi:DNA mismatch endonuclease (patch repair protein)
MKNAEFWDKKLEENTIRDKRVDEELKSLGWTVIRVWGHEVKEDPLMAAARISKIVQSAKAVEANKIHVNSTQ